MKTKFEMPEVDSAAEAWLPETVEVKVEDDFAPEFARVKGTIRKTPAAVVLERDRKAFANYLPFWDDTPEDVIRKNELSRGEPGDCQYSI